MIHKCKDSFKNRYEDKRESITEYKIYVGNQMSNITYQKVRYQENLEVQLVYKKCRQKKHQKARYKENSEKQIEY